MQDFSQRDPLSVDKLQQFAVGLAGLPPDEVRKAKTLYIRNALSEYDAMDQTMRAFGCVQVAFAIIPFFWPILYGQRRAMLAFHKLAEEKIRNAIDVWRDDLQGEVFEFRGKQFSP